MAEHLLTVPEAAQALRVTPWTLRKWLNEGTLQGVRPRPGGRWRVPQSALDRIAETRGAGQSKTASVGDALDTPQGRATAILDAMRSGDKARRNQAIIRLASSDEATSDLVEEAIVAAEAAYQGPQDDMSDWRALDGEPFQFPDEAPDFLDGLYRADKKAGEPV